MPQKIFCRECGFILYQGLELETPAEIIDRRNGECPGCRRRLYFESEKVKITPASKQIGPNDYKSGL